MLPGRTFHFVVLENHKTLLVKNTCRKYSTLRLNKITIPIAINSVINKEFEFPQIYFPLRRAQAVCFCRNQYESLPLVTLNILLRGRDCPRASLLNGSLTNDGYYTLFFFSESNRLLISTIFSIRQCTVHLASRRKMVKTGRFIPLQSFLIVLGFI